MSNPNRKSSKHASAKARSTKRHGASATKPAKSIPPRAGSKQETILTLLRQSKGASIKALMTATGWQQHSVRGFLAGVVRKKLWLTLDSEKTYGERVYRVIEPQAA